MAQSRLVPLLLLPLLLASRCTARSDGSLNREEQLLSSLSSDDECLAAAGEEACALNALQRKRQKASKEASLEKETTEASCRNFGCSGFMAGRFCQCNEQCTRYGTCCHDYRAVCWEQHRAAVERRGQQLLELEKKRVNSTSGCFFNQVITKYSLDWKAQGTTFFDDMTFVTVDQTHGANTYVTRQEALADGLISAGPTYATIRSGKRIKGSNKRKSVNVHTNYAWDPREGFMVAFHYKHTPIGPGVWPGFWTMASDRVWPDGGELDIMEYANNEANAVSLHTGPKCRLDMDELTRCVGPSSTQECDTDYFTNKFGCKPPQRNALGIYFAQNPGILAAEWTPKYIKVFHIPELQIPPDLSMETPHPEQWERFLITYMPLDEASCSPVLAPQELVLNIALCGDWAGATFDSLGQGVTTGWTEMFGRCHTDIWNPSTDCCTQYAAGPDSESTFQREAFYNIESVKVFTQGGMVRSKSGTSRRNGAPLTAELGAELGASAEPELPGDQ